ncbi:MAG: TrkH family potassium uptake protein [Candidatus Marinimicrobia bacterium]|nr:TrkH family potassium uptake protein [Candidatus Neomarinimicrobiota bacterium]MCF7850532.1 TrkH family potassium uptake protein [Candidatus Neomarinimicrobiota bacterium]
MWKSYSTNRTSLLPVLNVLAAFTIVIGFAMSFSLGVSLIYGDGDAGALLKAMLITIAVAGPGYFLTRHRHSLATRQVFLSVSLSWISASVFGALPMWFATDLSYTDCFFEAMSGFTTTGASILNDIESLPHGILFWRSFTHWLGGMGIIVFTVTVMPMAGRSGSLLFAAEAPGPVSDKITPRISETAKLLYSVYALISLAEFTLLWFGPMDWFDAACHTFGTMATGGFSTKNASVAHFQSAYVDWVIITFMIIAGTNFSLHYFALHGKVIKYLKNREWQFWMSIIAMGFAVVLFDFYVSPSYDVNSEAINALRAEPIRQIAFQVVSIITTTGFATADFEQWSRFAQLLLFVFMFVGGMAGSTGGGIKAIRILLFTKMALTELRRMIHPRAYLPIKLRNQFVTDDAVRNTTTFLLFFMVIFVGSSLFLTFFGHDLVTSATASISMLCNIGPGLGNVGPTDNYSFFSDLEKCAMAFIMMLGRLEVLTVIVLFNRHFWRS